MSPEPMIVQHDDCAIYHRRRWERTERSETTSAPRTVSNARNRCDWRCSDYGEGCIRRARNNSVGRCHVEIFVRPMRYKGCHQAHNAKVAICALFTTHNSLKLQGRRKVFFTHSQSSCHIAKVVLALRHDSRKSPSRLTRPLTTPPAVSSIGGLRTPAPVSAAPPSWGRHPQTFTGADVRLFVAAVSQ